MSAYNDRHARRERWGIGRWFRRQVPERVSLAVLALVTGCLTGLCVFLLKRVIAFLSGFLTSGFHADSPNWIFLLLPVAGIMLAGAYQRYVLKTEIYHGVNRLCVSLAKRQYDLPGFLCYAPMVASTLTLGFGGSAGAEGPIAYTGAAIGSNVGRCFHATERTMRYLIACGASAGIAGIFLAPVGGALFALEVLSVELTVAGVLAIFTASIVGWMMTYLCMGMRPDVVFESVTPMEPEMIVPVACLGLLCGLYALYYSEVMTRMGRFYDAMKRPWLKNMLSGMVVALLIFLFPSLYGEGYGFIEKVLADGGAHILDGTFFASDRADMTVTLAVAAAVLLAKPWASSSSNSGGGVAGDFAPTLFAGCVGGFLFAGCANAWFCMHLPLADFAFFGMGAVMAGAVRAPLMAIFLATEMAQKSSLLLPVVIAASISYALVVICRNLSEARGIFTPHLRKGTFQAIERREGGR